MEPEAFSQGKLVQRQVHELQNAEEEVPHADQLRKMGRWWK